MHQGILGNGLHRGSAVDRPPSSSCMAEDDQIVPIAASALLAAKLVKQGTLKVYPGLPHGMCTTHAERINPDLLGNVTAALAAEHRRTSCSISQPSLAFTLG